MPRKTSSRRWSPWSRLSRKETSRAGHLPFRIEALERRELLTASAGLDPEQLPTQPSFAHQAPAPLPAAIPDASVTWIDEGAGKYDLNNDLKDSIGTIGTRERPVVTYTGGLQARYSGSPTFDADSISFSLAQTGNKASVLYVNFTPTDVNGQPLIYTYSAHANQVDNVNLGELIALNDSGVWKEVSAGNFQRVVLPKVISNTEIAFDLSGQAAGNYRVRLAMNSNLNSVLSLNGRGFNGVSYDYEAVFQQFPAYLGTPDYAQPFDGSGPIYPQVQNYKLGDVKYAAGFMLGSSAPSEYLTSWYEEVSFLREDWGVNIVTLVADAGADRFKYASISGLDPVSATGNQFLIAHIGGYFRVSFAGLTDKPGTSFQVFTEAYPDIPARDVLEDQWWVSDTSTQDLGILGVTTKQRFTVAGLLRTYSRPGTTLGSSNDIDSYTFNMPTRGVSGSEVLVTVPLTTATNQLIDIALTNSSGAVIPSVYVPTTNSVRFDLNGYEGGNFTLNLQKKAGAIASSYHITIAHPIPTVSLGAVMNLAEGFGYGSTIAGLGQAVDTTQGSTIDGALTKPLGIHDSGKFTMEAWYYPKAGASSSVIWNYNHDYLLYRVNNNGLRAVLNRAGNVPGASFDTLLDNVLTLDAWNHVAVAFDGDVLRVFVNGVSVGDLPDAAPDFAGLQLQEPGFVRFQSAPIPNPQGGGGALDEVRVWNVARTQAEIQDAMLTPLAGTEPGLVGYWNFSRAAGNTELDGSPLGNALNVPTAARIENAAPQIGYVDVNVEPAVTNPLGLWVTYNLSGGTATPDVDFVGSSFRRNSLDPSTEKHGIIIPFGESKGRIYFTARPDAVVETDESFKVELSKFSFENIAGGQDYAFGNTSAVTLTLADNGAYRRGVTVTDLAGRPITSSSPIYVDPATKTAQVLVRLSSEPNFGNAALALQVQSGASAQLSVPGPLGTTVIADTQTLNFTSENWDVPQVVALRDVQRDDSLVITSLSFPATTYLASPVSAGFTLTPPNRADAQEGNPQDVATVKPSVSVTTVRTAREGDDQPGVVRALLNIPAPEGGLNIAFYVLKPNTNAALLNVDYRVLSDHFFIPAGELEGEIQIAAIDDKVDEADEVTAVVLESGPGYTLGTQKEAKFTIEDDEQAAIVVSNPSFLDISLPKDLARPVTRDEGANRFSLAENIWPSLGDFATFDRPGWTHTGAVVAKYNGSTNIEGIVFSLAATADPTAKIRVRLQPTDANGQARVPTVASGADGVTRANLGEMFAIGTAQGTRLQGAGLATPRAPVVVSDDTLEWSLAGLPAGEYRLYVSPTTNLASVLKDSGNSPGVAYDFEAQMTSAPDAPYTLVSTRTITSFASTYAPLSTNEMVPAVPPATEPNNSLSQAFVLGTVTGHTAVGSQRVDSFSDQDHFRFTLDSTLGRPDTLALLFKLPVLDVNKLLVLEVLNESGAVVASSTAPAENQFIDLAPLADGTYVARVRGLANTLLPTDYSLKFRTLNDPTEPEPGDTVSKAVYVGVATPGTRFNDLTISTASDIDYYRFTLDAALGRPSSVSMIANVDDGNLGLQLSSSNGSSLIAFSQTGNAVETISLAGLSDGDYLLEVSRQSNVAARNKYDLVFGEISPRASQIDANQVALRLDSQPTANVTLTLANADPSEGRLSTTTLTFTPDNWNTYQLVRVIPLDDATTDGDITYAIEATATSVDPNYQGRVLRFNVINVDRGAFVVPDTVDTNNEPTAPLVTIRPIPVSARGEGQTIDAFTVSLQQPLAYDLAVTLDFQRGTAIPHSDFTIGTGSASSSEVVIPAGATSAIVRATLLADGVDETADATHETLRATIIDRPGYRPAPTADPGYTASFEIFDNDNAGISVLAPSGAAQFFVATTFEDQAVSAVQHRVTLTTRPTADVYVYIASSDPTEGLIYTDLNKPGAAQGSLTFTPDNWNVTQNFWVKGVDDKFDDGNDTVSSQDTVRYQFTVTAQSDDEAYRTLAPVSYSASNRDNDLLGVLVSSPQRTVNGRTNIFGVSLRTQPVGEVRVTMTPNNDQIELNGERAGEATTLVFNTNNWNVQQLVQVVAVDDGIVEYLHDSKVLFSVEVGRQLRGLPVVDTKLRENAYDLGAITGGIRWSELSLPAIGPGEPASSRAMWFRINLPETGSGVDQIRLLASGVNRTLVPTLRLYKADGTTFIAAATNTPAVSTGGYVTQPAKATLPLVNVSAGEYLIELSSSTIDFRATFDLLVDDLDRGYETFVVDPVPVSIQDNDLPVAELIAGPTASEISSEPSYFAVRLNAPAPAESSDTGIKVNFQVTGGRATRGVANSPEHDYTVVADYFDVASGTGWVRVAPGDVQAIIGIVPVDDKLVEDLPLRLREFKTLPGGDYQVRLSIVAAVADRLPPLDPKLVLKQGMVIKAEVASGREVTLTLTSNAELPSVTITPPGAVARQEYDGSVTVRVSASDADALSKGPADLAGRVESEDVQVTLLGGSGYILPLAPEKQAANPDDAANLDPNRVRAKLTIYDDDVPGVQVISRGEKTTVVEGGEALFQVSLTAEPLSDVKLVLSPGANIEFVDPGESGSANRDVASYTLNRVNLDDDIDLLLASVNLTDLGWSAVFDVRLASVNLTTARTSKIDLSSVAGGTTASGVFQIPGISDVDFAGNPEEGNWNTFQRLVVTGLVPNADGSFSIRVTRDGTAKEVSILTSTTSLARTTTTLTFTPANWFQLQTVKIRAVENSIAEPGQYWRDSISYAIVTNDGNWNVAVPTQEVRIRDVQLEVGDTTAGFDSGVNLLEDSLAGLNVPILGNIGSLLGISGSPSPNSSPVPNSSPIPGAPGDVASSTFIPQAASASGQGQGFFEDFRGPLKKALASQTDITVGKFKSLAESALAPLVASGVFDRVLVRPTANDDEVKVILNFDKVIHILDLDLSGSLGLDALHVNFATTGKAKVDLAFSLDIGFGWHKQFGFYLDTAATGIQMGARLFLTGKGPTAENPANLFTGRGSIGPLQLDFIDDPQNRTELGITFDARLNDLDNLNTVRFFDFNGDGILANKEFSMLVNVDANNDGRADKDASGDLKKEFKDKVEEPWANISPNGVLAPFPTIDTLPMAQADAANANWNKLGARSNSFDEPEMVRNEGVYRLLKKDSQTLVYLDLNRDGDLDIARRKLDPFATTWTSLSTAEKEGSEIWFSPTSVGLVPDLKIVTQGPRNASTFYVDVDQDGTADPLEQISQKLLKKIDKNNSRTLEGDVIQEGEGTFRQGISLAFIDANGNRMLDSGEAFTSLGFAPFQLSLAAATRDSMGQRFYDYNNDATLNHRQVTTAPEFKLVTDGMRNTVFLDIDGDGMLDPKEPQAGASRDTLFIEQKFVDPSGITITFDGESRAVLTSDGIRFIDMDRNGVLTRDNKGRPVEPFAEQVTKINFDEKARVALAIDDAGSTAFTPVHPELQKLRAGMSLTPVERQRVNMRYDDLKKAGQLVEQFSDGDRLTLAELRVYAEANKQANGTRGDRIKKTAGELFTYTFKGDANLGLKTKTSIEARAALPSVQFDIAANMPLFNYSNSKAANENGLTVDLKNVALDVGTFLGQYVTPILVTANEVIGPIKPIIQALNADTKILDKIGLASQFEADGKPGISLLEIARTLAGRGTPEAAKIDKAIKFADHLSKLVNYIDQFSGNLSSEPNVLTFGDFSLNRLFAASDDPANSAGQSRNLPRPNGAPGTTATLPPTTPAGITSQASKLDSFKQRFQALQGLDGFEIKLFDPSTLLSLITGQSGVDLVKYDIPDFNFPFMIDRTFPLWGPIKGKLEGGFNVASDLSMGFDTHGIESWAKEGFAASKSYLVFDGFYVDDWNQAGADKDELSVYAYVAAGLGLDAVLANGFVKGGIEGKIGFDLVDTGERAGTSDGKVRGSDIVEKFSNNPLDLFDLHGSVGVFLSAEINVTLGFFEAKVYESRLASFEIARFKLDGSGFSGSALGGKVQTGPVAGATVWFDANNNLQFDEGEPFTVSDFEGNYALVVPDGLDMSTGEIRVVGGTDVSTGLPSTDEVAIPPGGHGGVTGFTALEEALERLPVDTHRADITGDGSVDEADRSAFFALLPLNPIDARLDIDGNGVVDGNDWNELDRLLAIAASNGTLSPDEAAEVIKQEFGINPAVDLSSFAHFDEALAGNPLAGPVMLAENNVNTVVIEIEALLSGLAGVPLADRRFVGYFSEASFQAIAEHIVQHDLDLTDAAQMRTIIERAAELSAPALAARNVYFDLPRLFRVVDDVALVVSDSVIVQRLLAASAANTIELSRWVTEAKLLENGEVAKDIYQVGRGELDSQTLLAKDGRTDEEYLDMIRHLPLPPLVTAIHDQFLFEDESIHDIPFGVRLQAEGLAAPTVTVSSDNPRLLPAASLVVRPGGAPGRYLLDIVPTSNGFGTAHVTLEVADERGGLTRETITVTVAPVNDVPVTRSELAIAIVGKSAVLHPLSNDRDADDDDLRLGLLSAPVAGDLRVVDHEFLELTPLPDDVGAKVFEYEADDANGGMALGQARVIVLPALTSQASVVVDEGQAATATGTVPQVAEVAVELTASVGEVVDNLNGTWTWNWTADDGPGESQTVVIRALYNGHYHDLVPFELIVNNTPPRASIDGTSTAVRGKLARVTLHASDASTADQAANFTYHVDWDGDGSVDDVFSGPSSLPATHAYPAAGDYLVRIVAIDHDGGVSAEATRAIHVVDSTIPGDANGDGLVQLDDYLEWSATFGKSGANLPGDFNNDGSVGLADYGLWAANQGRTSAASPPVQASPPSALVPAQPLSAAPTAAALVPHNAASHPIRGETGNLASSDSGSLQALGRARVADRVLAREIDWSPLRQTIDAIVDPGATRPQVVRRVVTAANSPERASQLIAQVQGRSVFPAVGAQQHNGPSRGVDNLVGNAAQPEPTHPASAVSRKGDKSAISRIFGNGLGPK